MKFLNIFRKNKYFLIKYILFLLGILIIIVGFFLMSGYFVNGVIAHKYPADNNLIGNHKDWIGFYGNMFGSLSGVFIAILIFKLGSRNEGKKYKKKLELELKRYNNYIDRLLIKERNLKKEVNREIKKSKFINPDIHYYRIELKDFNKSLIEMNVEKIINNEVLEYNMDLELCIEEHNSLCREIEIAIILSDKALAAKYPEHARRDMNSQETERNVILKYLFKAIEGSLNEIEEKLKKLKPK